jgi:hypothetical protein
MKRWQVSLPGNGTATVEANDRDGAIAEFRRINGVISTVHQFDVIEMGPVESDIPADSVFDADPVDDSDSEEATSDELCDEPCLDSDMSET